MRLADLRRVSIRSHVRIRFGVSGGLECVVNEHGIAQVPALRSTTSLNLEEELARAARFVLEPVPAAGKASAAGQILSREQLAAMLGAPGAGPAPEEHEE